MISRGVIKSLATSAEWISFINLNSCSGFYLEGSHFYIQLRGLKRNELVIGDVSNAYKRGKECVFYTLFGEEFDCIYRFLSVFDFDIKTIFSACEGVNSTSKSGELFVHNLKLISRKEKGVNTYSPFVLDRLNPLKEIPKKWTINHVIRMLANNQFYNLRTTGKYSDDYAFDSESNFQKGSVARNDMLLELVEDPRGWWLNGGDSDGEALGINCHSFDYKQCIVCLDGVAEKIEIKTEPKIVFSEAAKTALVDNKTKPAGILLY